MLKMNTVEMTMSSVEEVKYPNKVTGVKCYS